MGLGLLTQAINTGKMIMLPYPNINPVAFQMGFLKVHWYGLMYLIGFSLGYGLLALRIKNSPRGFTIEQLSDILFYTALGVIVGGRLGYMLFYNFYEVIHHPLQILMIWQGGMSFHGGLLGVAVSLWYYSHKINKSIFDLTDLIAPTIPIGSALGRLGNFINGELWGRTTDMPWGMVFPNAGNLPRHPSQLYEFFLEGIVMFAILWIYSSKPRPRGAVSGLFLILYGSFRILIEFFREPDPQIGYLAFGWVTEGQLLSIPMVIVGLLFMFFAYRGKKLCCNI